jgi:hypothetical protein
MPNKTNWSALTHKEKVAVLADNSIEDISHIYRIDGLDETAFQVLLGREAKLWKPANVKKFSMAGDAPTKDVVLGAWRDLDRAEALLELIDNSIDAWLQRRINYPVKTAPELNIYIDIDATNHQLTYEDNAGGVSSDKLSHLVVPGFSDTTPLAKTIGSYKTGGKKAVFRLASAAEIATRYWNPAETTDEAISVHLDQEWMENLTEYKFPFAVLKDKSVIEKGQTRYLLQLREEPVGGPPWFKDTEKVGSILKSIRTAYTLLLVRNPAIHIYFLNRQLPIKPLSEFYEFSGTHETGTDIRPQQVIFEAQMAHNGVMHGVQIEVVLGCRRSGGVRGGTSGGIDLYGNDRLIVQYDSAMFSDWLPAGSVRNYIRGFVNVRGPNVFVPWDTHKRHINLDREIVSVITKNPLIRQMFENWRQTYLAISRSPAVTRLIGTELPQPFDLKRNDLFIPHRNTVQVDIKRRRGSSLPSGFYAPKVKGQSKKRDGVRLSVNLTEDEVRVLSSYYGILGDVNATNTAKQLGEAIKTDILGRVTKRRRT